MHNNSLAITFIRGYGLGMETAITPQQIKDAAFKARVPLSQFLASAGVSRGVFYKWSKGGKLRPLTLAKLADAAEAVT